MGDNGKSIKECFSGITDPRDSNKRHQLIDIITIALCAVICGADTWEEIEEFGQAKHEWFMTFLRNLSTFPAVHRRKPHNHGLFPMTSER